MHKVVLLICVLLVFSNLGFGQKTPDTPNVVFILIDDMGWKDTGYMGSNFYSTPNIDKLASESMVFTRGYAGAANCAPSRAALMSGMSAPRTGVYTVGSSERGEESTRQLIPIQNTETLSDEVFTMAEMFQQAGYVTGHIGKWHLGESPLTQGFDVNVAGGHAGSPKTYFAPFNHLGIDAPEGTYLTEYLTEKAKQFLTQNRDKKFFLYLPFYTVHTPIQPQLHRVKKYKDATPDKKQNNVKYAGMIDAMDENVGEILDLLKSLNLEENTLIVFTSDNGGHLGFTWQKPLRGGKGTYYEGGIRVPLTVKWKGKITHQFTNEPVSFLDFYPTFADMLNYTSTTQKMDGESLFSFLTEGKSMSNRELAFHFPIYLQRYGRGHLESKDPLFRTRPGTVLIKKQWKLHRYYEDNAVELYNLDNDIEERKNLAKELPEKVEELTRMMDNWIEQMDAPIPTILNSKYDARVEISKIETLMKNNEK
ncbi:sulfatase [Algibacter mikhailovii]|uniref:Aryl-sulfate sulfohydrolase n=1 Tax=Algibacter mikhailovii TaxID=425498 RepID=A0A918VEG9_9FLAO|nr:sulfatase [Algibacter mikhailovii]GGZ92037.1 aryl-sulfate sulfohydrolase [Algibacter mikhailovii]